MAEWLAANPLVAPVAGVVALALVVTAIWLWRRRRNRSSIRDAIATIAVDRLENVLVPDGMGGVIHVEHLLLTTKGVLVLDVKAYEGIVFASDRMDQWSVIGRTGRSTLPNPLGNLYDRVAAVRQLVRDIEVKGFVLFPAQADFSKGKPADVRLPDDLVAVYSKPDRRDIERLTEAFAPHWDKIRQGVSPAAS